MALRSHHQFGRARIALVTAFALIAQPLTPVMGQTPAPQTVAPQTATVPLPSTTAAQKPTRRARPPRRSRRPRRRPPRRRRPSTADGRAPTRRQPVPRSWSTSRRSPSGRPRSTWSRMRPSASNRRARRSPRWARSRSRPTRGWRSTQRLVSFSDMTITESNFPTLSKEQTREIVDEDRQSRPHRRTRHRARPGAGHRRQEPDPPEERGGREGRPADDLLQPDAGRARQHRRRSDLEPDQGERPQVRRQHELGPLPARADEDVLPAARRLVADDDRPEGHVDASRTAARELLQAAGRRELEGDEGRGARQEAGRRTRCRRCSSASRRPR